MPHPVSAFLAAARPTDFVGEGRRYLVDRCFLYWQVDTRASGTFMFGKPLEEDISRMQACWHRSEDPRFSGRAVFVDARGVEAVDALAFKKLLEYLSAGRKRSMDDGVGSMTLIHTGGLVGVVTAGLLKVVRPRYRFQTFAAEHTEEAFKAAGVGDLFAAVDALRAAWAHAPDIALSVRAVLQKNLSATAGEVADALRISPRTLQRRLESIDSSLRAERHHVVMQNAEELLASTGLDLDAIASRLGLSSASHLVTHFRRAHGMTPGEWRQKHRG